MPKINKILEVHLSLDESLFGSDKIVWSLSFPCVVMTVVVVVVAPFFEVIITVT